MGREGIGAISRDRLEDGISALGPDERLGIGIVGVNESGDVGLEVLDKWPRFSRLLPSSRA